jgi:hypothetical protein
MSFKQAVDQVQVAWTTAPRTNGEFASQMGFRAGRKSCGLFVPHMNPFDVTEQPSLSGPGRMLVESWW